jgi:hypothetical protein
VHQGWISILEFTIFKSITVILFKACNLKFDDLSWQFDNLAFERSATCRDYILSTIQKALLNVGNYLVSWESTSVLTQTSKAPSGRLWKPPNDGCVNTHELPDDQKANHINLFTNQKKFIWLQKPLIDSLIKPRDFKCPQFGGICWPLPWQLGSPLSTSARGWALLGVLITAQVRSVMLKQTG